MLRSLAVAGLAVAAFGGSAGAVGEARIVPQKGIAGVRLGMTQAQVKATAGLPRKVERRAGDVAPTLTWFYRTYSVAFVGGRGARVTGTETRSPKEHTATGIRVGSTRAQVKGGVRGVRCAVEHGYDHCYVGRWAPGGTVTDFGIRDGRVWRISVGLVID